MNTGRVANRELGRLSKPHAMAWAWALAQLPGSWAKAFRAYMLGAQP